MPEVVCPLCRGRGLYTDPATGKAELCQRCGGTGTVPYLPAGVHTIGRRHFTDGTTRDLYRDDQGQHVHDKT